MKILSANTNNDIHAAGGHLVIATGLAAISQHCQQAVKAQKGEMVYAAHRGTNTMDTIFSGSPNLRLFEASVRQQIGNIDGVVGVDGLDVIRQNNTLSYKITINTTIGETDLEIFWHG